MIEIPHFQGCFWHGVRQGLDQIMEDGYLWGVPHSGTPEIFRPKINGRYTYLTQAWGYTRKWSVEALIRIPESAIDLNLVVSAGNELAYAYPEPIPLSACMLCFTYSDKVVALYI